MKGVEAAGSGAGEVQRGARRAQPAHHPRQVLTGVNKGPKRNFASPTMPNNAAFKQQMCMSVA